MIHDIYYSLIAGWHAFVEEWRYLRNSRKHYAEDEAMSGKEDLPF